MSSRTANVLPATAVVLLVGALGLLATLQYRWIDRVSDAERLRMNASLDFAMRRFAEDLAHELEGVVDTFARPQPGVVADALLRWRRDARHPELVAAVWVARREPGGWSLQAVDDSGGPVSVDWPLELAEIRARLERPEEGGPGRRMRFPLQSVDGLPLVVMPLRDEPQEFERTPGPPGPRAFLIVRLDREVLARRVLPELVTRHFSTGDGALDVAVFFGATPLFQTSPAFPAGDARPDAELPFSPGGPPPRSADLERAAPAPPRQLPPEESWRVAVRRHDGGIDAIVSAARRRNLALSFGVLAILAATLVTLVALLRRTARLHAQQTEFVASMSHELNTPVAALRSAGENLRDGIVVDAERLRRYGETIVRESSRLGDLLGQIMEFAGMQARRPALTREPVDPAEVVAGAVEACRWLAEQEGLEIEADTAASLPAIEGNRDALTRAVQNLLANAIRHGGSGGWAGLSAFETSRGIVFRIEDRGPGVDRREASRLFEPFYRGRTRARGAGLGLAIVRRIAEDHGGSVRLERRERGAAFVLELPRSSR